MDDEKPDLTFSAILVRILAWAGLAFLIGPLFVIIPVSFSSAQYLTFPPPGFSLRWYERFLSSPQWIDSIFVSLQVAVFSSIMTMVLAVLACIPLVRGEFRGKMIIYGLLLAPMIVPLIVTAIAVYFLFASIGLSGTVLAISIGHAVVVMPIVVIIVSATLQGFDIRIERAAISLGAHPIQAFFRVTLPVIAPGILSGGAFAFLTSFDELMIPLFLGGPETQTLAVRIWHSVVLEIEPTIAAVSTFLIGLALLVLVVTSILMQSAKQRSSARTNDEPKIQVVSE
jgi:putative spermidine/putrescine transport system permease protein